MIHCCDKCLKPILIYGRMIPCKHVFCLGCAKQEERICPRFRLFCWALQCSWKSRCGDKVSRVEQAGLGNIFLCTQGGSRYIQGGFFPSKNFQVLAGSKLRPKKFKVSDLFAPRKKQRKKVEYPSKWGIVAIFWLLPYSDIFCYIFQQM